jgi:DNA-binding LacI/PurR family transcriptional regulator
VPRTGRPTSKDVAQAAGVSQSTVSIVLTGKWSGRISPGTVRAVREAADRLGYRPNLAARNLRLGRARTVLLVVPTLTSPFFGAVYTGAARTAAEHGFGVVVYPWPDVAGRAQSPFAAAHEAIDGILASSMARDVLSELDPLPQVMLDSDPAGEAPTVNFDVVAGMRAVAAHLAALGHRRIGHVASAVDAWTFRMRAEALADAVRGLPGGALLRATTEMDIAPARAAATALLDRTDRPTALVCDDDLLAAGAIKAARGLGIEIPAELSITGFDDMLLAAAVEPELTTVRLPAEELGAKGMAALLELIEGRHPDSVSLPGDLIVRASTALSPTRTGGGR